jgi:hypothetical protein
MEHLVDAEPASGQRCDFVVPLRCLLDFTGKRTGFAAAKGAGLCGLWNYSISGCPHGLYQRPIYTGYPQAEFRVRLTVAEGGFGVEYDCDIAFGRGLDLVENRYFEKQSQVGRRTCQLTEIVLCFTSVLHFPCCG